MKGRLSYKQICAELVAKNFADDGMIAFGKLDKGNNFNGGLVGVNSWRYSIAKAGDDLVFVPIGTTQIYYNNMYAMHKAKIKSLKIGGFLWGSYLELVSTEGGKKKCVILKNKRVVRKILKAFGF